MNKKNYLDNVPYINENYTWEEKDGLVLVHVNHKGFYAKIAQKIFKKTKVSHIRLDELGSVAWKNINGNNNIYEISKEVKKVFGEKANPLYERLIRYFQILKNNKYIKYKKII